ncbi:MAG: CPBP family intramembrane metalloprotease [Lachnospiraceae bacterium]|nr:CPBP family intramembrane metalloprotease [Lachnospiraceae bacterium]
MTERKQIFKRVGAALAVGTFLNILGQIGVTILLQMKPDWGQSTTLVLILFTLPTWIIGYPTMAWILAKLPATKGEKRQMPIQHMISCIFLIFAAMYVFNWLGGILVSLFRMLLGKPAVNAVAEVILATNYPVLFFIMVIGAPIIEELIYRKLLIDKTLACGEKITVLTSALIFALVHGNFQQSLYTFFMGLLLAFIYVKTANILYPILLHMIINFVGSFLAKYMIDQLPPEVLQGSEEAIMAALSTHGESFLPYFIFLGIVFLFTFTGVVIYFKNRKNFKLEGEKEEGEGIGSRLKVILGNPGMILFLLYYGYTIVKLLLV